MALVSSHSESIQVMVVRLLKSLSGHALLGSHGVTSSEQALVYAIHGLLQRWYLPLRRLRLYNPRFVLFRIDLLHLHIVDIIHAE
jgi:hypothetical protein